MLEKTKECIEYDSVEMHGVFDSSATWKEIWHSERYNSHISIQAFLDSHYPPSHSFFDNIAAIEASDVFAFLHEMPKGGVLHVHDISIASIDWVVSNITYR